MRKPSKAQVLAKIQEIATHLQKASEGIEWIIEKEAWTVLGYKDLAELFKAEFKGTDLATSEVKKRVVFELLERGEHTQPQIADAVGYNTQGKRGTRSGVTSSMVSVINRQRKAGLTPSQITTNSANVKKHIARYTHKPLQVPTVLTVNVDEKSRLGLEELAYEWETNLSDVLRAAIRDLLKRHKKL